MLSKKAHANRLLVFILLTLLFFGILMSVAVKTSISKTGYELPSGWKLSISTTVPQGGICDRSLDTQGFPFTTRRPYLEDAGGCNDSVNVMAKLFNLLAVLALSAIASLLIVSDLTHFKKAKND